VLVVLVSLVLLALLLLSLSLVYMLRAAARLPDARQLQPITASHHHHHHGSGVLFEIVLLL